MSFCHGIHSRTKSYVSTGANFLYSTYFFFTRNVASKPLSQILSLPIFFRLQKLLEHYNCATVKERSIEHIPGSGSLQDVVLSPPYPESLF